MIPHIAVILTDNLRRILWVNEDFTRITGYAYEEVIGKSPGVLLQGPETEPEVVERIRLGLSSEIPFKEEITNYRKNGEAYVCKLVIYPIHNPEKELINFLAFEVDGNEAVEDDQIPLLQVSEKYQSSSLKGVEEVKLYFRLKDLIEQDKLYLDASLNLKMVADLLNTNTKYLSQVVNHLSGRNFQFFINTYRVKEAMEKLTDDDYTNLTLYGIALQCGFKNKSTFYKVFKEITSFTPKDYIISSQK